MRIDLPQCNLKTCRLHSDGNCIRKSEFDRCEYARLRGAWINEQIKLELRDGWILCDERLPTKCKKYEVTLLDTRENHRHTDRLIYDPFLKVWYRESRPWFGEEIQWFLEVLAWKPLSKPYIGEVKVYGIKK